VVLFSCGSLVKVGGLIVIVKLLCSVMLKPFSL